VRTVSSSTRGSVSSGRPGRTSSTRSTSEAPSGSRRCAAGSRARSGARRSRGRSAASRGRTWETVIAAVAAVMEIEPGDVTEARGGLPRMLVAHLAFTEGVVRLREIARSLALRSAGHVSNLVRRCAEAVRRQGDVAGIAEACLARLRPAGRWRSEVLNPDTSPNNLSFRNH
jgi:hypothetical protein